MVERNPIQAARSQADLSLEPELTLWQALNRGVRATLCVRYTTFPRRARARGHCLEHKLWLTYSRRASIPIIHR